MGWYAIPDDITIAHGSQFTDVVKVLRPFMMTPDVGIEIDILGEKLFLYAFTLLFPTTCSSNRPQRRHRQYPLFEGDSSCSTCKISRWILFYSNPASSLTSRPRITIIDDWCRRYRSRENPVVCHGRWGSEGGRAAKV
jgi:hypothetical protein